MDSGRVLEDSCIGLGFQTRNGPSKWPWARSGRLGRMDGWRGRSSRLSWLDAVERCVECVWMEKLDAEFSVE